MNVCPTYQILLHTNNVLYLFIHKLTRLENIYQLRSHVLGAFHSLLSGILECVNVLRSYWNILLLWQKYDREKRAYSYVTNCSIGVG